jgi:hypothetical protein
MAITTTGSTVQGLVKGMEQNCFVSGTFNIVPNLLVVNGDPNTKVTGAMSGIAYDIGTGEYYIMLGTNVSAGGSTWRILV